MRKTTKRRMSNALTVALLLVGIGLVSWPWVADMISEMNMQTIVATSTSQYEGLTKEQRDETFLQAQAYNTAVAEAQGAKVTDRVVVDNLLPYADQLTTKKDPMMSWIEIPTIDLKLPIYHGTSADALMAGVGHLEGTSLPIGGESTHCVLSGHSGMSQLSMFDNIRNLAVGDEIYVHTLGDVFAYRVYDTEVVLPDDMSSLRIADGKDIVTLVTCTPYGVNDHRLLVHCRRVDYTPEEYAEQTRITSKHLGMRDYGMIGGLGAAAIATTTCIARRCRRGRKAKNLPR